MRDSAKTPASMAFLLKLLPSVERLVADTTMKRACEFYGRPFVTNAAREVLANARAQLLTEDSPSVDVKGLAWLTRTRIEEMMTASLTPVFNLTGRSARPTMRPFSAVF